MTHGITSGVRTSCPPYFEALFRPGFMVQVRIRFRFGLAFSSYGKTLGGGWGLINI